MSEAGPIQRLNARFREICVSFEGFSKTAKAFSSHRQVTPSSFTRAGPQAEVADLASCVIDSSSIFTLIENCPADNCCANWSHCHPGQGGIQVFLLASQ